MSVQIEKHPEKETTKTSMRIDSRIFLQLKHLALDQDRSISGLIEEGLGDLLRKYGRTDGGVQI